MPLPPVKHKYAVKLDGSDKNFVYQYSPSVSANVSTTNGIVTGATINGSRIEKANVFSLDRILQVLVNCDVCDQRRSGGCLKLLSKFRKDSALQSCSKCHQQLTRRVLADRSNTIQAQSGWCVSNNGVRPIQNSFCAKIVFFYFIIIRVCDGKTAAMLLNCIINYIERSFVKMWDATPFLTNSDFPCIYPTDYVGPSALCSCLWKCYSSKVPTLHFHYVWKRKPVGSCLSIILGIIPIQESILVCNCTIPANIHLQPKILQLFGTRFGVTHYLFCELSKPMFIIMTMLSFLETLTPVNIKRKICQVTGNENFSQHVYSQLEMGVKKRKTYDPM